MPGRTGQGRGEGPIRPGSRKGFLQPKSGPDILVKEFLRLHPFGHGHERPLREYFVEEHSHERLGRRADTAERQGAPLLHALRQGLDSGSLQHALKRICGQPTPN